MSSDAVPMVGIVVVNYFGGDMTIRCLESLEQLTWPAHRLAIALVDNGSAPGDLDRIRDRFPRVRIVETGANLGFGGGCNRGFAALRDCDHVALLNNDAVPEPDWLEPLVEVLEADPTIGAAVPKVLLSDRFAMVELRSPTVRPGGGDTRRLGVQLCGARVDGVDVSNRIQLVSGFWGWEHDAVTVGGGFAWTDGAGTCRLPVPASDRQPVVEILLACGVGSTDVEVVANGEARRVVADVRPTWVELGTLDGTVELVNSAGTLLLADGATADRGFMEPDGPRFSSPSEVFGWSGAAVLLSGRYLDDIGGFDEPYFLYYEDVDLSWRGRLGGWTYRYEPASCVRHEHSATIGDRSGMARHLLKRNRLLTLTKHAPAHVARRAARETIGSLLAAARADVVQRVLHLRRPVSRHIAEEARVLGALVPLLPRSLRHRRSTPAARREEVWTAWVAANGQTT